MNTNIVYKNENSGSKIIDGRAFLIFLDKTSAASSDILYICNKTGTKIWELIDGKKSIQEISGEISEEFEISQMKAERDVESFIRELVNKKLLIVKE